MLALRSLKWLQCVGEGDPCWLLLSVMCTCIIPASAAEKTAQAKIDLAFPNSSVILLLLQWDYCHQNTVTEKYTSIKSSWVSPNICVPISDTSQKEIPGKSTRINSKHIIFPQTVSQTPSFVSQGHSELDSASTYLVPLSRLLFH